MKALTKQQEALVVTLVEAARRRKEAEAEWRASVARVNKLLAKAERDGVPLPVLARAAGVSRQYLHKRAKSSSSSPLTSVMRGAI